MRLNHFTGIYSKTVFYIFAYGLLYLLFQTHCASAEEAVSHNKVIEAEEFRLVSKEGKVLAEIKPSDNGVLVITYKNNVPQIVRLDSSEPAGEKDETLYKTAHKLLKEKQYDEVIELLLPFVSQDPGNFQLNLVMVRAQVEQCAILKEKRDPSYKSLLENVYIKGKQLYVLNMGHPEPYYIIAKSLLINDRAEKAKQIVNNGLYYEPENTDLLILLGDINADIARSLPVLDEKGIIERDYLFTTAASSYRKALQSVKNDDEDVRYDIERRLKTLY